ncbi:MAG: CRTAC1 family protein, partial [Bacteroidota bacterium]
MNLPHTYTVCRILAQAIISILFLLLGIGLIYSQDDKTLFTLLDSSETHIHFSNRVEETPESFAWHYDYFYNGGGVAIADLNKDGLPDIFFAGNSNNSQLYLNEGDLSFKEVSDIAGINPSSKWSMGVNIIDVNNDGWLDIYVCNGGPEFAPLTFRNQLFIHQGLNEEGIPTFIDMADEYGLAGKERSVQSVFFDLENDGDLDLFVMNNTHPSFLNKAGRRRYRPTTSHLYRREENGSFTDITSLSGLEDIYYGLGVAVRDFNEDGYLDIYVTNDYVIPDYYWINQGDGTFKNEIKQRLNHTSFYGMGCDAADLNNDGLEDLFVLDMTPADHIRNKQLMPSMNVALFHSLVYNNQYVPQYMFNTLQLNQGEGYFGEVGLMGGIAQTDWSWSTLLADFDLDGNKDVFVSNGFFRDINDNDWQLRVKQLMKETAGRPTKEAVFRLFQEANSQPVPNVVFQNLGDLTFKNQSQAWGLDQASFSHGAAYADLDQDGDLDLVINNFMSPAMIYRNNADPLTHETNFIRFDLSGNDPGGSSQNARIFIHAGAHKQVMENTFVRGYLSQVEPVVHFGLGTIQKVDYAEIYWQDGSMTRIDQPAINQVHRIKASEVKPKTHNKYPTSAPYFTPSYLQGL